MSKKVTILSGHVEGLSPELWQAFKHSPEHKAWGLQGDLQSRIAAGK